MLIINSEIPRQYYQNYILEGVYNVLQNKHLTN